MVTLAFGAGTDIGKLRRKNEDRYLTDASLGLFLIADGMGGHAGGDIASAIAAQKIESSVRQGESIDNSIQQAHLAVRDSIEDGSGMSGMGTTIVALLIEELHYQLAWVGDSRAYLWRGSQNNLENTRLSQITKDQSLVQVLVDIGEITQQEARSHPKKNIITQYIGQPDIDQLKIDSVEAMLEPGQKILLCSDGLSDEVSDDKLTEILQLGCDNQMSDQSIVSALIAAALRHGGRDNVTAIVVSC